MEEVKKILKDFHNWLQDKPVGIEDKEEKIILVGINGVWQDAIQEYLKTLK